LKNFLTDRQRMEGAQRRGGGKKAVAFDDLEIDRLNGMARSGETPEELFDREWAYELMITAIDTVQKKLKKDGRETYWKIYQAYDLDPAPENRPTYSALGEKYNLKEDQVTKHLQYVRNKIRDAMVGQLNNQVATEEDLHREMEDLLGK
jgi:hypothetical protein